MKERVISLPVSGTWLLGSYEGLAATLISPCFGQVAFQPRALRNLIKVQLLIVNCKTDKCRDSAAFARPHNRERSELNAWNARFVAADSKSTSVSEESWNRAIVPRAPVEFEFQLVFEVKMLRFQTSILHGRPMFFSFMTGPTAGGSLINAPLANVRIVIEENRARKILQLAEHPGFIELASSALQMPFRCFQKKPVVFGLS